MSTSPSPPAAPNPWPDTPPASPPVGDLSGSTPRLPAGSSGTAWGPAPPPGGGAGYGSFGNGHGPSQPPPPSGRTGLLVAAALVVVVLVIVSAVGVVQWRNASDTNAAPPSTSTPSSTAPSTTEPSTPSTRDRSTTTVPRSQRGAVDPAAVKQVVAELSDFVEKERGLEFKNEVTVEVLPDVEFQARVLQEFEKEIPAMTEQGELLQALGILRADVDPVQAQRDLLGAGVLGFYDPVTKALVVRGDNTGPFFREIVVHELVHALDDQHFDLDRPELVERKDGSDFAFLALVEGNARRIQYAYRDQLSPSEQQTRAQEEWDFGMQSIDVQLTTPIVLARILMAPYDYGNPFVTELVERKGQTGLDAAYATPPVSSEQILDADKFEEGEAPIAVAAPEVDGEIIDEGVLGELMTGFLLFDDSPDLMGMLEDSGIDQAMIEDLLKMLDPSGEMDLEDLLDDFGGLPSGTLPGEAGKTPDDPTEPAIPGLPGAAGEPTLGAVRTVDGWGGDRYVLYRNPTAGTCVRVDWKMDTLSALAIMDRELRNWSATSGATIERPAEATVRMTRCVPPAPSGGGTPTSAVTPTTLG